MSRLRKRIAERLKESQNTAALLTTYNEADMSTILELRRAYRDGFEKKHGVRLGFMGFFVKACIAALQEIPAVNAEIDGDDIVYKNHYDIGVAVGTEHGLVVPVVRDADQLSLAGVEATIAELGVKARDGKLTMDELTGGTFTISNGGVYGSLMSMPILNPPQSGILGMHKIQEAADGGRRQRGPSQADDVCGAQLRPPHHRRPRGGDLPGAGEGEFGGPTAVAAGGLGIDRRLWERLPSHLRTSLDARLGPDLRPTGTNPCMTCCRSIAKRRSI